MDGFSVAAERHVAGVLRDMQAKTLDHLPAEIKKRVLKEARDITNRNVFGEGHKKDRKGNPIEQGLGSHANPTAQSIAAYKKYCGPSKENPNGEDGYREHLAAMEKRLTEFNEERRTNARDDD